MASTLDTLSRREREIMAAIYRLGEATVSDVLAALPDPPSYSAVRTQLGILESKGHLRHRQEGRRYVYLATEPTARASKKALRSVLRTFFGGSPTAAVAALLEIEEGRLSESELSELADLVAAARGAKGA
jgi:predicted transcriptional regulator